MKRAVVIHSVLLVALAAGGISTGRWLRHSTVETSSQEAGAQAEATHGRKGRTTATSIAPVVSHDLAALRRFAASDPDEETEEARQMARIPTAELKAMVLEVFARIDQEQFTQENFACFRTIAEACRVLYDRDGSAAYDWAAALPAGRLKSHACSTIIIAAASREPALAEKLGKIYQEENGQDLLRSLTGTLLESHLMQGDMTAIARLVADNKNRPFCPTINFPADFDFPALLKVLDGKAEVYGPVTRWAMRNPDAAWAYVAEHHPSGKIAPGSQTNLLNTIFKTSIMRDGSEKGVAWTLEKISTLSPEQRTSFLGDLNLDSMELPSGAVSSFLKALSETDRRTVVSAMHSGRFLRESGLEKYLSVLEVLPREEMLVELTDAYQDNRGKIESPDAEVNDEFQQTVDKRIRRGFTDAEGRFHLTPEELARIKGGKGTPTAPRP